MPTLTVGDGKTYSTISAAYTASSAGDTIEVYHKDTNGFETYSENFAMAQNITINAIDPVVWEMTSAQSIDANVNVDGFYIIPGRQAVKNQ